MVQRELIDPVDMFVKHYLQSNSDLLKSCEATWTKLHLERTNMILNKENYFNQMFQLHQLKKQVQKEPQLQYLESHQKKLNQQQSLAN